jgi:hypothetical protein
MRKAYLFIFSDGIGGKDVVRAWANQENAVLHWRTDMPNSFYIISEESATYLSNSFLQFNGKKGRFLIIEVSENRQGILPKETWYLLRHKKRAQ